MILRNDLRGPDAGDAEIFQLTTASIPASHVYMEAQICCPDSRRFVLHEAATAHGSDRNDPRHRYLLCDLDQDGSLLPLTDMTGATAPALSPDGRYLYYVIDETDPQGGKLTLQRVRLDGSGRETLLVLDTPVPETNRWASRIYPLSTMRSDGRRLALPCFLGDGRGDSLWGLLIFDLEQPSVRCILAGPTWCNVHPQYSRSLDPIACQDLLVQENHGTESDATGKITVLVAGLGADIHVMRDDGTALRDLPWGRDGNEQCQGHQCWRGRSDWAITSTSTTSPAEQQLIESQATAHTAHAGRHAAARRNDLSRDFPWPRFYHFATDRDGKRLITDSGTPDAGGRIYTATLREAGRDALGEWRCLAEPRSSWIKEAHIHPFLSPDGSVGFFNSDESGQLQAYMIRGLD